MQDGQYDFGCIEKKWQNYWQTNKTFRAPDGSDPAVAGKPKYYVLDMFPYPSGAGLHVGHPEGYTASDIVARYKRMKGFNVLHPIGWDAFGLPAEQYAVQTGTHPAVTTQKNIDNMRRQIQSLGFSYDWDRRGRYHRHRLLQMDAVDLSEILSIAGSTKRSRRPGRSRNCRYRTTSTAGR